MKKHYEIAALLHTAQSERRCAFATTHAQQQALHRRIIDHDVKRVGANLYIGTTYWNSLGAPEQALHMARALHRKYPYWQFGGITAAAAHGFEHRWSLHDESVTITTSTRGTNALNPSVKRIYTPQLPSVIASDIPVTDESRTVVDCAITLRFRDALPIFDSALAHGLTKDDILSSCGQIGQRSRSKVRKLLRYANAASENGGESLTRGTIIEQRFMPPNIQVQCTDPLTGKMYRCDFMWRIPNGSFIVGELDGTEKYVNPTMTDRQSIRTVVANEREREQALSRCGIKTIVRFTFDDVMAVQPLVRKLAEAGIPRYSQPDDRTTAG